MPAGSDDPKSGDACAPEEDVVRAVQEAHFDRKRNRASSSLFAGPNTSVSRVAISSVHEIWEIFKNTLQKISPDSRLVGAVSVRVGTIQGICAEKDLRIDVVAAPEESNKAHAEIVQRIKPKTLRKKINESSEWVKKVEDGD